MQMMDSSTAANSIAGAFYDKVNSIKLIFFSPVCGTQTGMLIKMKQFYNCTSILYNYKTELPGNTQGKQIFSDISRRLIDRNFFFIK
jgi:hypothetical protein